MYKIWINDTPLHLVSDKEVPNVASNDPKRLVLRYPGKKKFLLSVINQLESAQRFEQVTVFSDNLEKMWADFLDAFKFVEAAGGLVQNEKGETLFIFRRDSWDLPKGKMDPGETPPETALREVREEVGLQHLELGPHLTDTWHTYQMKGKRYLKKTYWFLMKTTDNQLVPQTEEDIELAVWRDLDAFLAEPEKVYGSILEVLNALK